MYVRCVLRQARGAHKYSTVRPRAVGGVMACDVEQAWKAERNGVERGVQVQDRHPASKDARVAFAARATFGWCGVGCFGHCASRQLTAPAMWIGPDG